MEEVEVGGRVEMKTRSSREDDVRKCRYMYVVYNVVVYLWHSTCPKRD